MLYESPDGFLKEGKLMLLSSRVFHICCYLAPVVTNETMKPDEIKTRVETLAFLDTQNLKAMPKRPGDWMVPKTSEAGDTRGLLEFRSSAKEQTVFMPRVTLPGLVFVDSA